METFQRRFPQASGWQLLTSSEVELMETFSTHALWLGGLFLLTSSEVELMETHRHSGKLLL